MKCRNNDREVSDVSAVRAARAVGPVRGFPPSSPVAASQPCQSGDYVRASIRDRCNTR
jgi:hypothetical protein